MANYASFLENLRVDGPSYTLRSMASTSAPCPTALCGVWKQDRSRCESLCPLLEGLGLPKSLLWAACPVADATHTTLRISCPSKDEIEIVDKTVFGRNATRVPLDGNETLHFSKGRGKTFMLSGAPSADGFDLNCRLVSRGDGWHTRQERSVDATGEVLVERHVLVRPGKDNVVVQRLFTRTVEELRSVPPA